MSGEFEPEIDPKDITAPRLVHMKKGDEGYGFNLHGEKGVHGQHISAVDKGSRAEIGGLREGDRVVEVNGTNVEYMKHGEVVALIKQNPSETTLLVIDKITEKYLKNHNRPITADMANLKTVYVESQKSADDTENKPAESVKSEEIVDVPVAESGSDQNEERVDESIQQEVQEIKPQTTSEVQQEIDTKEERTDDLRKAMEEARLAGKSKRRNQKSWQDQKKVFESL